MKYRLILLSVMIFAITLAAFATGSAEVDSDGASEVRLTAPGEFPIVEGDPVTLSVFMTRELPVTDYSYEGNAFTKWYTDLTNVELDLEIVDTDAVQKMNVMLAAQSDLPDVFLLSQGDIGADLQTAYGNQGVFLRLNEYIDELGFGINRIIENTPDALSRMSMADGSIYALPRVNECYHCTYAQRAWINQRWLDNLGLEMPETLEEFYDVLVAFKTLDPNGNGLADEIPMTASPRAYYSSIWGFITEAFIYHDSPGSLMINDVNGEFIPVFTQPEFRDALRFVARLYREEMFDDTVFTQDRTQLRQLVMDRPHSVGVLMMGGVNDAADPSDRETFEIYQPLPPLAGPDGVKRAMQWARNFGPKAAITSAAEHPEVAFRWLDGFYLEDVSFRSFYGVPGVDWRDPVAGEVGFDGEPAYFSVINQWGIDTANSWHSPAIFFWPERYRTGEGGEPGAFNPQKDMYVATKEYYEPHGDPEGVGLPREISYTPEELETLAQVQSAIRDYVGQSIAEFILGRMDIETDWQAYLQQLDALRLGDYVDVVEQAVKRQYY